MNRIISEKQKYHSKKERYHEEKNKQKKSTIAHTSNPVYGNTYTVADISSLKVLQFSKV